jgi:hypothetical protein
VVPLTPARPKPTKKTSKVSKPQMKQLNPPPSPPSAFATRQLQASNNRRSAAVLFTPHRQRTGVIQRGAHIQQSSPTLRLGSHALHPAPQLRTRLSQSSSEGEKEIEVGLQRLDLGSRPSSDASSDLQSGTGQHSGISQHPQAGTGQHSGPDHYHGFGSSWSHSQSDSNSYSHRSQPPRAGPHSKSKNPPRPRGGAKDVWTFFKQVGDKHECQLCK